MQAILNAEIHNQKDIQKFLGAANFYRRHIKNFTFSAAPLSELLKKTVAWHWGVDEQRAFEELKAKFVEAELLGVPNSKGEIVMITDASEIGGGSTIFQWQSLDPLQVPEKFSTIGCNPDGTF